MSSIENTINYTLDNIIDQYAYYLDVGVVIAAIAIILQIKNIGSNFLTKKQSIMLAALVGLFQVGSFILMVIKTVQIFIRMELIQHDKDMFPDRNEGQIFKWEIFSYTIVNLLAVVGQARYLKLVSTKVEKEEIRDSLITTDQNLHSDS